MNGSPGSASSRHYLRGGLPAMYREGNRSDFGMRFVGVLETVLDPIVALLDNLPRHFDPEFSPEDLLMLLGDWLAVEHQETRPLDERRELIRRSAELAVKRGTAAGLKLALELGFTGIPLRIEDGGGVWYGANAAEAALQPPEGVAFVVYCDVPLPESEQRRIARFIAAHKPVHVNFKLRVRNPSPDPGKP